MKRSLCWLGVAAVVWGTIPAASAEQTAAASRTAVTRAKFRGMQRNTPTVSPYINLSQESLPAWFNYYTLVRPQVRQLQNNSADAAQIQLLEQQAARAAQRGSRGRAVGPRTAARFMDYSQFYPTAVPVGQ